MINYHHKITQTVYRLCFHFWTLFWTEINITSLSYMYTVPRPAFMLLKFSSFWLISVLQSCIAIGCSQLKRKKRISVWFNRINAFCNKAFCCWCIFNFSLAHLVWFYRLTRRRLLKKCVWSSKATSCDISKHFPCSEEPVASRSAERNHLAYFLQPWFWEANYSIVANLKIDS